MHPLDWERLLSHLMILSGLAVLSALAVTMIITMIGTP